MSARLSWFGRPGMLAWLLIAAACSRAPRQAVVALDVRVPEAVATDAAALARAVEALEIRLEAFEDRFEPRVRVAGPSNLVIELVREPSEPELDRLRELIARVHTFQVAVFAFDPIPGVDYDYELKRLESWWSARPGAPLEQFNRTPHADGGPAASLAWYLMEPDAYSKPLPPLKRARPCLSPTAAGSEWFARFSALDLERVDELPFERGRASVPLVWKPKSLVKLELLVSQQATRRIGFVVDGEMRRTHIQAGRDGRLQTTQLTASRERLPDLLRALRSAIAAGANPARLEVTGLRKLR